MTPGQEEIDRIVREVLRRLRVLQPQSNTPEAGKASANGAVLQLPGRIISLAQLSGRLNGVRQVQAAKGAIVTPAARDLLRQQKITLTESNSTQKPSAARRLVAGMAETNFDPTGLIQAMNDEQIEAEHLARTGLVSIAGELAERVARDGALALLLTEQPAAALCLANRRTAVRAAQAGCVRSLRDAVGEIGVNFLVVNPRGKSTFELRRIVSAYVVTGGGEGPAWLAKAAM